VDGIGGASESGLGSGIVDGVGRASRSRQRRLMTEDSGDKEIDSDGNLLNFIIKDKLYFHISALTFSLIIAHT
jgi:hypothetical protein